MPDISDVHYMYDVVAEQLKRTTENVFKYVGSKIADVGEGIDRRAAAIHSDLRRSIGANVSIRPVRVLKSRSTIGAEPNSFVWREFSTDLGRYNALRLTARETWLGVGSDSERPFRINFAIAPLVRFRSVRMMRVYQVRICERLGVEFPGLLGKSCRP